MIVETKATESDRRSLLHNCDRGISSSGWFCDHPRLTTITCQPACIAVLLLSMKVKASLNVEVIPNLAQCKYAKLYFANLEHELHVRHRLAPIAANFPGHFSALVNSRTCRLEFQFHTPFYAFGIMTPMIVTGFSNMFKILRHFPCHAQQVIRFIYTKNPYL